MRSLDLCTKIIRCGDWNPIISKGFCERRPRLLNPGAALMETVLVKIFATALALSQVLTAPENLQTRFDRVTDLPVVAQLLRAGCAHMRKALDIENINLDELISTAMEDPQAIPGESKAF